MDKGSELEEAVREHVRLRDGREVLDCAEAFRIAGAHDAELLDIARICNRDGIKIVQCQLGCFK